MARKSLQQRRLFMERVTDLISLLPPLPSTIASLVNETSAPETRAAKLREAIGNDSGLCADLLLLANCPCRHHGGHGSHNIETIEEAIKLVGIDPLADFIVARFAIEAVKMKSGQLNHLDEYAAHSQEISRGCGILGEILGYSEHHKKMLSVAGLIHDIGRLLMLVASEQANAPLVGTSVGKLQIILSEENDIWGMDHSEAGARICHRWHLPAILEEAVLRHHNPLVNDDFSLHGGIILVSHFVVMSDFTGEIISRMLTPKLLDEIGLNETTVDDASRLYEQRYQS